MCPVLQSVVTGSSLLQVCQVVGKLGFWKLNTCAAAALSVGEIAYSLFECASCKDRSILDNLYLPEKLVLCPMIMASTMEMVILKNIKKRQDIDLLMVIVVDSHRHEMVA